MSSFQGLEISMSLFIGVNLELLWQILLNLANQCYHTNYSITIVYIIQNFSVVIKKINEPHQDVKHKIYLNTTHTFSSKLAR